MYPIRQVQSVTVPKTMLKEWAMHTFPGATDYWVFRKQLTMQLALAGFAEFVLHLTRLNPDMIYIHQDSGLMNVSYFRFDVDDMTGELTFFVLQIPFHPNSAALKNSIIKPILYNNKEKKTNIHNYRPISLTSHIAKSMERIILSRITRELEIHILHNSHRGLKL